MNMNYRFRYTIEYNMYNLNSGKKILVGFMNLNSDKKLRTFNDMEKVKKLILRNIKEKCYLADDVVPSVQIVSITPYR